MSHWDQIPPVCALSGSHKFYIRREMAEAVSRSVVLGRRLVRTSDWKVVRETLDGSVWDDSKVLILFEGDEINEARMRKHMADQSSPVSIAWFPEGKHKFLSEIPLAMHGKFELPKPWDQIPEADSFVSKEARRLGIEVPDWLAKIMVKTIGPDLALLSQEVWKFQLLLAETGRNTVTVQDYAGVKSPLTTVSGLPLIPVVGHKLVDSVSTTLTTIKSGAPVILPVLGLLLKQLRQWVVVKSLPEQDADTLAAKTGINAFIIKKEILPIVSRWELPQLVDLMREVISVKKGVKVGAISPWTHLEAVLLKTLALSR